MIDGHLQIGLGPVQPDAEGWSRNWFGWDPMIGQQELWDHNCEVWRIHTADLHKFWLRTNRVLTLVAMPTKLVVVVAQVTAILLVTDIDSDQVAPHYLNRYAFRGRVLVDHELIGQPWEFIPPATRQWPVQLVPGTVSLMPAIARV